MLAFNLINPLWTTINLLERKINGFKLFMLKRDNLYLDFTLAATEVVHIEFTPFNKLNGEYSPDSETEILKQHGFKLNDNANILYMGFDLKDRSTRTLMTFLSQLFLKPFYSYTRKNFELSIY